MLERGLLTGIICEFTFVKCGFTQHRGAGRSEPILMRLYYHIRGVGTRSPAWTLRACAGDAQLTTPLHLRIPMSFQDIEAGLTSPASSRTTVPQSQEESSFLTLQSSLSLQVFKINANVQGILKLVDQLGTGRDSGGLRKSL